MGAFSIGRGRRRAALLLCTALVAGLGVAAATGGSAGAAIQTTGTFDSVCTTTLLPNVTNSFNFSVDVPDSADPGAPFTVVIPGGSIDFPASNRGFAISSYQDLSTQFRFENATIVAGSVSTDGQPTINGTPTTGFNQIPDPTRLKYGTAGPIPPGTLVTPATTFLLVPTVAGTPVRIFAEQAGTSLKITSLPNLVVATCPLERRLVAGSTTVYEVVPKVVATISVTGTPPSSNSSTSTSSSTTTTTVAPPSMPTVSVSDVTVDEPLKGTAKAAFVVTLSAPSDQAVSVKYATSDDTATQPADYTKRSGSVTIPKGKSSATVNVIVKSDKIPEPDETFFFDLLSAKNANIGQGSAIGTIVDIGPSGLSIENAEIDRPERGTATMTFTVTLTRQPTNGKPVTVRYRTADLTATAGSDYRAKTGIVRFSKKKLTATIKVPVLVGDYEGDESFIVELYDPTDAVLSKAIAQGLIIG